MLQNDIENYLKEVKNAILSDRFIISRNKNRPENERLFMEYILNESRVKEILLNLTVKNFSEVRPNEHPGYEDEKLYIFGTDVKLLERFGTGERIVSLYIKFNKLETRFVIVISFHEHKYPLTYPFRRFHHS